MSQSPVKLFHAVVVMGAALTGCGSSGAAGVVQEPRSDTQAGDGDGQPDTSDAGAGASTGTDAVRKLKTGEAIPADSPCQDGSERPYPTCFYIL